MVARKPRWYRWLKTTNITDQEHEPESRKDTTKGKYMKNQKKIEITKRTKLKFTPDAFWKDINIYQIGIICIHKYVIVILENIYG